VTDTILPLLNIHFIPNLGDTFVLIWAFAVVYGMAKYKFLTITPATAAANILATMFDLLVLLDLKGDIVAINKSVSHLSGYSEDVLKGRPVEILLRPEFSKDDPVKMTIAEGNLKNKDFVFKTKAGKEIPVLFSSSILRDEAGAAAGIVCIAKDISERRKLEAEIFNSKKLESIGILAGGIAHDFNNLLAVIMGNLALAQEDIPPDKNAYTLLEKAQAVSLKAAELAEKFITFSPGGWLKKKETFLSRILKDMEAAGLPGTGINISYAVAVPGNLALIDGDEDQLKLVVENLFRNAVEAISGNEKKDGTISVSAENTIIQNPEDQNKFLLKKGHYVKISIKDNGAGIPAHNIEKVFDPYFSTKEDFSRKGLGLGLTTCYSIIKKHDGHITIQSEEGKGTTVTLYLPAFKEKKG
ncbi:MAG: PAS domain S-box protein, partial [bacterium]|nr:PAS domain S-box protein [bacterium]